MSDPTISRRAEAIAATEPFRCLWGSMESIDDFRRRDESGALDLTEQGVLAIPGTVFETPGVFRICLTATDEMCEQALPAFDAAIAQIPASSGVGDPISLDQRAE